MALPPPPMALPPEPDGSSPPAAPPVPDAVPTPVPVRQRRRRHHALAALAAAGLVLTACFLGIFILRAQYGQRAISASGFGVLSLLWLLGLIVTASALVWAIVLALHMQRWGWAIGLVVGTLALAFVTVLTLPGVLVLVFAVWGPTAATEAPTSMQGGAIGQERAMNQVPQRTITRSPSRLRRGLVVISLVTGVVALLVGGIALWVNAQQFRPSATLPSQLAHVQLYVDDGRSLSAVRASDGHQLWRVLGVGGYTIAAADGLVYTDALGVGPGTDCCTIDAIRESDGSLLWQYTVAGGSGRVRGASEGLVYIGQPTGTVTAVQASDGKARWQFTTDGSGMPNVATADGVTLISGTGPNSQGVVSPEKVYALRSTDGTQIWKWEIQQGASSVYQPVVAQGVVYVGSEDGHVYALRERDGTPLWRYDTGDVLVPSTPAVANGTLYVGANGYVTALGAHDGTVIWRYRLDSGGFSRPSPAVADGVVYASSTDGNLYALRADAGQELWHYHVGNWLFETPPLAVGGAIFYGVQVTCPSLLPEMLCTKSYLYALRASDGAAAWRLEVPYGAPVYMTDPVTDLGT